MTQTIDLRVDTLGDASPDMLKAMMDTQLGDDVMGEDSATNELEAHTAELCGKEAALLVPSGTMGNLLALLVHVPRGGEIIIGSKSHIFNYEAAGAAALGSIAYNPIPDDNGILSPDDVRGAIRSKDIYSPRSALICAENTHNMAGGLACQPEELAAVAEIARENELPFHLDGARLLYACAALGVEPQAFTQHVDTLMFSSSRGSVLPLVPCSSVAKPSSPRHGACARCSVAACAKPATSPHPHSMLLKPNGVNSKPGWTGPEPLPSVSPLSPCSVLRSPTVSPISFIYG